MDTIDVYLFWSPASVFVAIVTVAFLLNQARARQKQSNKLACPPVLEETSGPAVAKEPEVPEGWWSSREVFELERRALFSKVCS